MNHTLVAYGSAVGSASAGLAADLLAHLSVDARYSARNALCRALWHSVRSPEVETAVEKVRVLPHFPFLAHCCLASMWVATVAAFTAARE